MMDVFGVYWAGIDRILLAPLFILVAIVVVRNYWRIKQIATMLVHQAHQKSILKHFSLPRQRIKLTLLLSALTLIFLALLQPQWGKKEHIVMQEGRDVLIVLDISRSMRAKDIKPNRLDYAKLKIRNLLNALPCERVGLIVFSGAAFVLCPLTSDHAAFKTFLENVDTEAISSGSTALDKALNTASDVFASASARKNKLVVLLTDGEDFSFNLETAQRKAVQENMHIFAIGVGTPDGAPIPKFDDAGTQVGHETDEKGNIALSKLNEAMLQNLCEQVHGLYVPTSYDDSDIATITSRISTYEKEKFDDKKLELFEDHYPWFLAAAWACLMIEWIV